MSLLQLVGTYHRNGLWTPDGWLPAQGRAHYDEQCNLWNAWRLRRLAMDIAGGLRPAPVTVLAATATTHKAYETIASVLTTELNSLTTASYSAASAAQGADGTGGPLAGDFEFVSGGAQTATNSLIGSLWTPRGADGTNYEDSPSSTNPTPEIYIGTFVGPSGSSTKRAGLPDRPLPPGLWKLVYQNNSGSTHAASGNTVKVRAHSLANA